MKRKGNLYQQITNIDNLQFADAKASAGKGNQYGVRLHLQNRDINLLLLNEALDNKTYCTGTYETFTIFEPKERLISALPYYPDRITHHAIMNVLEPVFVSCFTADTYSCIKGRGIHGAANKVRKALQDVDNTTYCLKLDIKKFYPSINHDILKSLLRRKIKDNDLLWLLDEIIDSAAGVPIGNYLSQYFANYYLSGLDHWLKETIRVKYYFRYADDIVILHNSKPYLHNLRAQITSYLADNLKLTVKENYQVFPIAARGIDFVGYVFYHTHTFIRPDIKRNFARMLANNPSKASIAAYYGWLKHADTNHLLKKLLPDEELQRFRRNACNQRVRRRQDKYRTPVGQRDNSS